MINNYSFQNKTFVIEQYDKQKTFSSFLPGLAGKRGIPLWAFYVNRGQGISSFGLRDKNGAIMEFYPANLAYLYVSKIGFRTFIKVNGKVTEFFHPETTPVSRQMHIKQSEFSIVESNHDVGLEVKVTYYGLPNESIAGLVRHVEVKNITKSLKDIEIIDGISQILPSGIDYGGYKAISNLLRSWMDVENLDHQVAFYKLRSSTGDEAETKEVKDGNFYLSIHNNKLVTPLVDCDLVFGEDTALNHPAVFTRTSLKKIILSPQYTANKVPCGFTPLVTRIGAGESLVIDTIIGYAGDISLVNQLSKKMSHEYFENKRLQAAQEIEALLQDVNVETNVPIFDEYIRQNYLDNLLRGGYPMEITNHNKSFIYYLYSRKHGDLERDYNFFSIAPEFYSQGNGNFRDVCQNRRNDVLIRPETKDYSVHMFASLIQSDGYNPLSINGSTFELNIVEDATTLAHKLFSSHQDEMASLLKGKFTPGSIVNTMAKLQIDSLYSDEELFKEIFSYASQNIEASHGEGYWVDHWTYILDLVENFLHVYPDQETSFLFDRLHYRFYDSAVTVYPRSEKTVLDKQGNVRQYGSLRHPDKEKIAACKINEHGTNWLKTKSGVFVETSLIGKLIVLAVNKYALLDPELIGIEMEANKPGWNDAMNGLPGLFASGVSETIELARLIRFLLAHMKQDQVVPLPVEFIEFAHALLSVEMKSPFETWNQLASIREAYREHIRFGTKEVKSIHTNEFVALFQIVQGILDKGIDKAIEIGKGIIPTFLTYEATRYELILNHDGQKKITHYGLPAVKVHEFVLKPLPYFLEAPARFFKYSKNMGLIRQMADQIKQSGVYDAVLHMYKTSDDLDEHGYEIGRIRAFTKGWLEREANFLHMTYKYLLGLLKSGNVEYFFEEAKTNLVCFLDPALYGRSTLENSSFIATSNNPNPMVHGQGFVSRLTGSTAEMLSIYMILLFGTDMYQMKDSQLTLSLKPSLPAHYFKNGRITARFQQVTVEYVNPTNQDSWLLKPTSYDLIQNGHTIQTMSDSVLRGKFASMVRSGEVDRLIITLG